MRVLSNRQTSIFLFFPYFLHCPCYQVIWYTVQHADIPLPQSAAPSFHPIANNEWATAHFVSAATYDYWSELCTESLYKLSPHLWIFPTQYYLTLSPVRPKNQLRLPLQIPVRPKYRPAGLWFIPVKPKYRLGNFEKKTVKNNVVSESSMSGDPMLWQLRVERVNLFVNNDTKQQKRTTDNRQSALWVVHCRQPAQLFCSTDKSANRQFLSSVSRLTSVRDASNWLCNRSKQFQPNVFNSSRYSTNQADLFCMKSEVTIMTRCNTVSSQLFNLSNITRKNSTKSHWCIRFHLFWPYMVWSWPWPLIFWPHFAQVAQPPITHVNQLKLLSFNVLWQQHGPKVDFCPYLVW